MKRIPAVLAAIAVVVSLAVAGPASPAPASADADEFTHVIDTAANGRALTPSLTLHLGEVPLAGADFAVFTQAADASFTDVTADLVRPTTYLGTVDGRSDAMVAATRLSNGDLWGQVVFDRGATWFFKNDVVSFTRGIDPPAAFDKLPTRQSMTADSIGSDQYSFQVGFDVDSAYYATVGGGSAQTVIDHAFHSLNNVRATYMQNVGLMPQLGTIRIRTSVKADPYSALEAKTNVYLPVLRSEWRTNFPNHPNDQVNVISSRMGGGITYGVSLDRSWTYAVIGAQRTDWDIVLRHEVGHNFFLADGHAGGFEGSTIDSGNLYARFDSAEVHTFAAVRQARISQGVLTPEGRYVTTSIPPYAATDLVDAVAGTTGAPAVFTPLANDHSANGAALTLTEVDGTSALGARVETAPDGSVHYTPLAAPTAAVDHFVYTVADGNGMTATGLVLVRNTGPFEVFEAENQQLTRAKVRQPADDLSGNFSGRYIDVDPDGTVTLNVQSPEARDVTVSVRMRNADAKKPSTTDVAVNGTTAITAAPAPAGASYSVQTHAVHLQKGANVIRYSVKGAAQRLDFIRVDWPDSAPSATTPEALTAAVGTALDHDASGAFADPDSAAPNTDTLSFSLDHGPAWLSITADGRLSGTPTAGGETTATVRATDAFGAFTQAPLTIVVAVPPAAPTSEPPVAPTPAPEPAPEEGSETSETPQAPPPSGNSLPANTAGSLLSLLLISLGILRKRAR